MAVQPLEDLPALLDISRNRHYRPLIILGVSSERGEKVGGADFLACAHSRPVIQEHIKPGTEQPALADFKAPSGLIETLPKVSIDIMAS